MKSYAIQFDTRVSADETKSWANACIAAHDRLDGVHVQLTVSPVFLEYEPNGLLVEVAASYWFKEAFSFTIPIQEPERMGEDITDAILAKAAEGIEFRQSEIKAWEVSIEDSRLLLEKFRAT